MKYIKFVMSEGRSISLPFHQAEQVIDSPEKVIKILDEQGKWTGTLLNKAHIVSADVDVEMYDQQRPEYLALPEVPQSEEEKENVRKIRAEISTMMSKNL